MEKNKIETKICCKYCGCEFSDFLGSINHICERKFEVHEKIWAKNSIGRCCKEKIKTPVIHINA